MTTGLLQPVDFVPQLGFRPGFVILAGMCITTVTIVWFPWLFVAKYSIIVDQSYTLVWSQAKDCHRIDLQLTFLFMASPSSQVDLESPCPKLRDHCEQRHVEVSAQDVHLKLKYGICQLVKDKVVFFCGLRFRCFFGCRVMEVHIRNYEVFGLHWAMGILHP